MDAKERNPIHQSFLIPNKEDDTHKTPFYAPRKDSSLLNSNSNILDNKEDLSDDDEEIESIHHNRRIEVYESESELEEEYDDLHSQESGTMSIYDCWGASSFVLCDCDEDASGIKEEEIDTHKDDDSIESMDQRHNSTDNIHDEALILGDDVGVYAPQHKLGEPISGH